MKNQGFNSKNTAQEHGNVIFFILIVIALLATLTMVLSRGSQNTVDASGEQVNVQATKILRTMASVGSTVQNLISRGCSENDISFENSYITGYANGSSPSDRSCWVFDVNGGGLTWQNPPSSIRTTIPALPDIYNTYVFSGKDRVTDIGTNGTAASNSELYMMLANVTKDFCLEINRQLNIPQIAGEPPSDTGMNNTSVFTGTYDAPDNEMGDEAPELEGRATACYRDSDAAVNSRYNVYHVLIAR